MHNALKKRIKMNFVYAIYTLLAALNSIYTKQPNFKRHGGPEVAVVV